MNTSTCSRRDFLSNTSGLLALAFGGKAFANITANYQETKLKEVINLAKTGSMKLLLDARYKDGLYADEVFDNGKLGNKSSIASTGYGLTNLVLAVKEGLIDKESARKQFLQTLNTVDNLDKHNGWLYHFYEAETGKKYKDVEISSIDTVLFYANALVAAEFFGGAVKLLTNQMFEKVNFNFMLTNGGELPNKKMFSHGFRIDPNGKLDFIKCNWDTDSEGVLVAMMALAQKNPTVTNDVWFNGFNRNPNDNYPLFIYFYPAGILDIKSMKDLQGLDLYQRGIKAITKQEEFCERKGLGKTFGITACQGPEGYYAFAPNDKDSDGSVLAPPAVLSMLPFNQDKVMSAASQWWNQKELFHPKYGIIGSFSATKRWKSNVRHTIDFGSMSLMLDQFQDGTILNLSKQCEAINTMIGRIGFSNTLAQN